MESDPTNPAYAQTAFAGGVPVLALQKLDAQLTLGVPAARDADDSEHPLYQR